MCAICVFYCCVNNARSLRLLVKPLRQWYALPLLLLTVTLVMRALFLVALLLPFSFLSATSVIRTVFVVVFSFLVCFFYYRYASNLCQSNTCPLWQVFDWLYDSDSNQTLAPFGKCIESLWKFSGIYFLMVELFLPVLSPILHIGKEISSITIKNKSLQDMTALMFRLEIQLLFVWYFTLCDSNYERTFLLVWWKWQ